jgi:lipopolysaccharide export LptBFGC system permease protein LptF
MKMKKIIYALLSLILIITLFVTFWLDPLGKKYAQEYAQKILKTPVHISQFESSLFNKNLKIDFIEVQNPPNFKQKNALYLNHFALTVSAESDHDLIIIEQLAFDGLKFTLEENNQRVNLNVLLNNLKKSAHTENNKDDEKEEDAYRRIKIKKFSVQNISLKINTRWLKTTLKVPNISAHNFGGESGIELNKIGKRITQEILQNLKKMLKKQGIKETISHKISNLININKLKEKIKHEAKTKIKDKAKNLLKGLF